MTDWFLDADDAPVTLRNSCSLKSDGYQSVRVFKTDSCATMSLFAASSDKWGANDFTFAVSRVPIIPVPQAILLLGSSLNGLVGLTRRKTL